MKDHTFGVADNEEEEEYETEDEDQWNVVKSPRTPAILVGCCCLTVIALCTGFGIRCWVDFVARSNVAILDGSCKLLDASFEQGEEGCWQTTVFHTYYRSVPCLVSLEITHNSLPVQTANKTWLRYEAEDAYCYVPHTARRLDDGRLKSGWYASDAKNCATYLQGSRDEQNLKGSWDCNFMIKDSPFGGKILDTSEQGVMAGRASDMLQSDKKLSLIWALTLTVFAVLYCIFTVCLVTK